ncbi:unnamed protein product [Linum trigynum]|uniref:Uncharacterized protein n=1 Tax=Linum trigynum TaxID=586398 RepID=A0AAV2E407_9ROSI
MWRSLYSNFYRRRLLLGSSRSVYLVKLLTLVFPSLLAAYFVCVKFSVYLTLAKLIKNGDVGSEHRWQLLYNPLNAAVMEEQRRSVKVS